MDKWPKRICLKEIRSAFGGYTYWIDANMAVPSFSKETGRQMEIFQNHTWRPYGNAEWTVNTRQSEASK